MPKRARPPRQREQTALLSDGGAISFQAGRLVGLGEPIEGKSIPLGDGDTVVGSASESDLVIDERSVSRRHCQITRDPRGYRLQDLGSTNGTFLDTVQIKDAFLRPGAVIDVGGVELRFEVGYEAAELSPSRKERFGSLLGRSAQMRQIFTALTKAAPSEATILLRGETGTGKGAVARAIHAASARKDGPFVVFDCGATAQNLLESELFGHERGAFTGAVDRRIGALEAAKGGTLFIDELAELSLPLQPKLLRALEEREFVRLGGGKPLKLDCRVVASTQVDLWEAVQGERFRQDLYFRLAVVSIALPSLRERDGDLPLLVDHFLREHGGRERKRFDKLDVKVREQLEAYDWPGNVRELRNAVERLCVMGDVEGLIDSAVRAAPKASSSEPEDANLLSVSAPCDRPFKEAKELLVAAFEKEYLARLLTRNRYNIAAAAREAKIGRRHLYTLLDKHGLWEQGS